LKRVEPRISRRDNGTANRGVKGSLGFSGLGCACRSIEADVRFRARLAYSPASDQRLHPAMVAIGHWQNGAMIEEWLMWDNQSFMKQIGSAPSTRTG
jgi:hypothetical protein